MRLSPPHADEYVEHERKRALGLGLRSAPIGRRSWGGAERCPVWVGYVWLGLTASSH